jgi:hypothetical protein
METYNFKYCKNINMKIILSFLRPITIYLRFEIATHHVTIHNTPIHNILSTAPQLSISQKELGTLPEDGNLMPKHEAATIHN